MTDTISKTNLWISRIMGGIVILFMLMDSIAKFIQPAEVVEGTLELGFAEHHIIILGILGRCRCYTCTFGQPAFFAYSDSDFSGSAGMGRALAEK